MAYSKQTWDTTSYVNPTRMNHIEDGIANADLTNKGITIPNYTGSLVLLESFVVDVLLGNKHIGTADTWVDANLNASIENYEFLGFSFARSDNSQDQGTIRAITKTSSFKLSSTSYPIAIVEDYANVSDSKSVLVAYKSDSSIYLRRGSNIYTYSRLSVFGILKKS